MRIGYIVAGFPVLSESFVVNAIRGLENLGHQVTAIALGEPDPATAGNPNYQIAGRTVRVRGLWPPLIRRVQKLLSRWRLQAKYGTAFIERFHSRPEEIPQEVWKDRLTWDAAIEQIDRRNLDVLYVQFAMNHFLLGYHAARALQLPLAVSLSAHDLFANPLRQHFGRLLAQCAFVVVQSGHNRDELLRLAPNLRRNQVRVLPSGVDVERFRANAHDPHRPFRFAASSVLVETKGLDVLMEAAGILSRRRDDFRVQVVGEGPMREYLEQRRRELALERCFELLGGHDASFMEQWLPDQDAFALPCVIAADGDRDGAPVEIREAMACGLPVLSSTVPGLEETVAPGTGLRVPPNDPALLADAMECLVRMSAAEYRRMGAAACAKARTDFVLAHEVQLLSRWLERAVRARQASSEPEVLATHSTPTPA